MLKTIPLPSIMVYIYKLLLRWRVVPLALIPHLLISLYQIERTEKILHTVDVIAESALKALNEDESNKKEFTSKTMNLVVGLSKLNTSANASTDIGTTRKICNKTVTSMFRLPSEIKDQLEDSSTNGFKFQVCN